MKNINKRTEKNEFYFKLLLPSVGFVKPFPFPSHKNSTSLSGISSELWRWHTDHKGRKFLLTLWVMCVTFACAHTCFLWGQLLISHQTTATPNCYVKIHVIMQGQPCWKYCWLKAGKWCHHVFIAETTTLFSEFSVYYCVSGQIFPFLKGNFSSVYTILPKVLTQLLWLLWAEVQSYF